MNGSGFERLPHNDLGRKKEAASFILRSAAVAARALPMPLKKLLYRLPWLSGLIRKILNRAAPSGLTRVRVAAGRLAGLQLELDLQTEKDYWLGTYEPELQTAVRDLIRPGMVVYDVGANIGYLSLLFARIVGASGKVFAFEALPENVERLRKNIRLNQMESIIEVVPVAVVECARPVRFLRGPSGGMGKAEGSAGRTEMPHVDSLEIEGLSLDEFHYSSGTLAPEAVKMDIEGGEVLALPGMQRMLVEAQPLLFLELHGPEATSLAWQMLSTAGYRLCKMAPGYPGIEAAEDLDWKAYVVAING